MTMKKVKIYLPLKYLASYLWCLVVSMCFGQYRSNDIDQQFKDKITFFNPCGDISFNMKGVDGISEALTLSFKDNLKTSLDKNASIAMNYYPLTTVEDSLFVNYFFSQLPYLTTQNRKEFDKLTVDRRIFNYLGDKSGRYFGVMFIDGYAQRHYTEKVIGGTALFLGLFVLSLGSAYYLWLPKEPFGSLTVIIVDRWEGKYVFYKKSVIRRDPMGPNVTDELVKDVFNSLSKK